MTHRKNGLIIIAIIFAVYNLLAFAIPFQRGAVFWVAYTFAVVAILGQGVMDWLAFRKADSLKRVFLGVPILKISFRCLCAQLFVCAALMIAATFVSFQAWIAIVLCSLILAFASVAVLKADWVREVVEQVDAKHLASTKFMHEFRAELQSLALRASDPALKAKLAQISEAARYSDPVSAAGLAELEAEMGRQLALLRQAVVAGGTDAGIAEELLHMLNERNQKSRALKRQQYQA